MASFVNPKHLDNYSLSMSCPLVCSACSADLSLRTPVPLWLHNLPRVYEKILELVCFGSCIGGML